MIFNKHKTFPDLTFSRINLENCGHPLGAGIFHIIHTTFLVEESLKMSLVSCLCIFQKQV